MIFKKKIGVMLTDTDIMKLNKWASASQITFSLSRIVSFVTLLAINNSILKIAERCSEIRHVRK
jgi:hypothetical protein